MATNKKVFTLRLSDEVFDKIGILATKERRSMTNYIEYVLIHQVQFVLPIDPLERGQTPCGTVLPHPPPEAINCEELHFSFFIKNFLLYCQTIFR